MRLPAFVLPIVMIAALLVTPAHAADPFGEEITLTSKPLLMKKGAATLDTVYDALVEIFKQEQDIIAKQGLKPAGPAMAVFTSADDRGFEFEAGIPLEEVPKGPLPEGFVIGKSPEGKLLKFVHRGAYGALDMTYEAITNYLDERRLDAKELFIEQYVTDPVKTPENQLVIDIFVRTK